MEKGVMGVITRGSCLRPFGHEQRRPDARLLHTQFVPTSLQLCLYVQCMRFNCVGVIIFPAPPFPMIIFKWVIYN